MGSEMCIRDRLYSAHRTLRRVASVHEMRFPHHQYGKPRSIFAARKLCRLRSNESVRAEFYARARSRSTTARHTRVRALPGIGQHRIRKRCIERSAQRSAPRHRFGYGSCALFKARETRKENRAYEMEVEIFCRCKPMARPICDRAFYVRTLEAPV